jgi:hypothetical protein
MQTSRKLGLALALAALLALPAAAEAPKLDPLVPADAEMVVVFNVRQLFESPLVKKYGLKDLKDALKKNEQVGQLLTAAGVDPFKDVTSVVLAGKPSPANDKMLVVVRGNFDPEKIHKVAVGIAEKKPGELKITKEGDRQVYETKAEGKPAYATFADKGTLIVSPSKEYTLETAKNAGKAAARPSKELTQAVAKVSDKDALWLALVITDEMKQAMAKNPQTAAIAPKLEAVTGSLTVTDDLKASVLIHTTDPKAAAELRKMINQVKPLLAVFAQQDEKHADLYAELLSNLKITADAKTVDITLKVSQELIEKAAKQEKQEKEKEKK